MVVARSDNLRLKVTVQGVGPVTYVGEDSDPMAVLDRTLFNADVDGAFGHRRADRSL